MILEIICAGSLALSASECQNITSMDLPQLNQATPSIVRQNIAQKPEYLAKGKPHKSKYRREEDRQIEEFRGRGRDRYDRDRYRRRDEYDDDYRGRIYREPDQRGREVEYDRERRRYDTPRSYRNRYFRRYR